MDSIAAALLVLALLCGCGDRGSSNPEAGGEAASLRGAERLTEAPLPPDLDELDPAAVLVVRRAAAAVNDAAGLPGPWTRLGIAFHAHRRFESARVCYVQRLLRDEEDAKTWYYLALIDELFDAPGQAIEHFERSIRLDPAYPPSHWRLGLLLLSQGDLDHAEGEMQAALDIAPFDAASVVGMARVCLQQGQVDVALELLQGHMGRFPEDGNARYLLGTAYRRSGRMEDAQRMLAGGSGGDPVRDDPWQDEMMSHRRGYRTEFLKAIDLLAAGRVPRAIALFEALHEKRPEDTLVHLNLHRAYRLHGELDRAIDLLLDAERIKPFSDMVHFHLAGAYRDKAMEGEQGPDQSWLRLALESARRACELSPTFANAHGLRGDVLLALGIGEGAVGAYSKAMDLDRGSVMWHQKTAQLLCAGDRWGEAVPVLQRLDGLRPGSPQTLILLAAAFANSGRLDEAQAPLEEARRMTPDDPTILQAISDLERARRQRADALPAGGGDQ